ncbi:ribonuclease R family protein [Succinimonas amylolytica]|uniref:ribonuclease R family protein n=1 Tax=Succinimonas amylolytica TaxID=83769 RepID=UPI0023A84A91
MSSDYRAFVKKVVADSRIPDSWPEDVLKEDGRIPESVRPEDMKGRQDLRDLPFVTIDGETSCDYDDGVYARKNRNGWQLYVAIADVSWYVQPDSPADREAYNRGNSVYFQKTMIPMLPKKYATGICSLNPFEDRLCLVCEMNIARNGSVCSWEFYPAVINSHARLTYPQVRDLISGKQQAAEKYRSVYVHVYELYEMSLAMREWNLKNRPAVFQNMEPQYVLNAAENKVVSIRQDSDYEVHWMIEACMVAANTAAARYIRDHGRDLIYRTEDYPLSEKLSEFRKMISSIPETLGGGSHPSLADLAVFAAALHGKSYEDCIRKLLLRHQTRAEYTTGNIGHYLLGISEYTHFTSPIRRYADLTVHRIIRQCIELDRKKETAHRRSEASAASRGSEGNSRSGNAGGLGGFIGRLLGREKNVSVSGAASEVSAGSPGDTGTIQDGRRKAGTPVFDRDYLNRVAAHCTETERRSQEAGHAVTKWLNASFMSDRIGQVFNGTIIATREFGLFVNLPEFNIDVFVYIGHLGSGRFTFSGDDYVIRGPYGTASFYIGQPAAVQIAEVNVPEGKVRGVLR